jgi:Ca2+-transporting ATPase
MSDPLPAEQSPPVHNTGAGAVPAASDTEKRVNWHQLSVEETFRRLSSDRNGLTAKEAAERQQRYGPNVLEEAPPRSPLAVFGAQFADFMILVLIAAAVVSGLIGELTDTIVIVAIIVLNAVLGFVQEYRAERAMLALKEMAAPSATVIRDGVQSTIPAAELVPGDLVLLEAGRIVPADLRLVETAALRLNESALTGESVPVDKSVEPIEDPDSAVGDRKNVAYKGSFVTYGRGAGLVIATGMRTEFGRIARLLSEARASQTPLQRRLANFGKRLAVVVLLICAIVFATGLMRGEPAWPMLLVALSLAVAAIPEALPAVVSISLALGARKMVANRALIRRLPAVETLGSVTFICSDKTGTLTANQMRLEQYYCDGKRVSELEDTEPARLLLHAMAVSHDAGVDDTGAVVGDPTEVALVEAAKAAGIQIQQAQKSWPRVGEIPFDSERKCMTTVHAQPDGSFLSITKGAAEVIAGMSDCERRSTGSVPFDRERLGQIADEMAANGLRVLGFGVRRWQSLPAELTPDVVERELEFLGLVGLIDPPRSEAQAAIATCKSAGIVPVMITGDHPATAAAIARRLGLLGSNGELLTGPELEALSSEEFKRRVREVSVYARVAPEQKLKIVGALQASGEIVAMTGDGVNDAPALKQADVGIAMGIQGTDVAKEASAMVLLDDNFATIVRAVAEGRRIYDNLRRFVRYVLTTNSAEIWTIFLAPFLGLPVPLLPIQILWINLVTDGLPGLALASEPAERNLMRRPPRPPAESLFAQGLGAHALVVGLLMAALTLGVQAWYVNQDSPAWQTALFTTLCFAQLAHVMAIRSERTPLFSLGLMSNKPLLGAVTLTVILQLTIVYVPVFNELFSTVPLSLSELAVCVCSALIVLIAVELEKAVRRYRDHSAFRQ